MNNVMETAKPLNRSQWGLENYRNQKEYLVNETQKALSSFRPISADGYHDNPIQVLDFFCGAGGTSLGFAALKVTNAFESRGWKVIRIWECELQKKNREKLEEKLSCLREKL